ncbi:MAG: hypothetical protein ACREFN_09560, partial [Acetobacteraceae bacterium]
RIICVSYAQDLADKHARDCRAIMQSDWYRALLPTRLAAERQAVGEFTTTAHGFRLATSVGGVLTGRGADVIIIDDPLKPEEALSDKERERVNEWFDHTLLSRLDDKTKGTIILIMQRLHEDDLVGHVLSEEPWLADYLHELTTFPKGRHDDQADSTAQLLDWVKQEAIAPGGGRNVIAFYEMLIAEANGKPRQDPRPWRAQQHLRTEISAPKPSTGMRPGFAPATAPAAARRSHPEPPSSTTGSAPGTRAVPVPDPVARFPVPADLFSLVRSGFRPETPPFSGPERENSLYRSAARLPSDRPGGC